MFRNYPAVWVLILFSSCLAWSLELPQKDFLNLSSQKFQDRESAQSNLLAWSRLQPEPAMDELFRQSKIADDPEVRARCLSILRELVIDDYAKEGEGYIGIGLRPEIGNVPGDPVPRGVIRVTMVQPDTPAHKADIRLNDLIVGLDQDVWHEVDASLVFREKIRMMKPNSKVELKILRDGVVSAVNVSLARRPLMADQLFFNGQNFDLETSEKTAKEAYFQLWLNQRKLKK
jgi:hypothetical protein